MKKVDLKVLIDWLKNLIDPYAIKISIPDPTPMQFLFNFFVSTTTICSNQFRIGRAIVFALRTNVHMYINWKPCIHHQNVIQGFQGGESPGPGGG